MDKVKQWVALALVGCLAVLAAGWFLLVAPKRAEAADLQLAKQSQDALNSTVRTHLQELAQQARDLPAQQAALEKLHQQIPSAAGLSDLLRALEANAGDTGVDLVDITPSQQVPLAAADAVPGAAPAATSDLGVVTITMNVVGPYFPLQLFVAGLEDLTRAARVTSLSLAPGSSPLTPAKAGSVQDGRTLTAGMTLEVYVDSRAGAAPAAASTTPAATTPAATTPAAPAATTPATTPAAPATTTPASGTTGQPAAAAPAGGTGQSATSSDPAIGLR